MCQGKLGTQGLPNFYSFNPNKRDSELLIVNSYFEEILRLVLFLVTNWIVQKHRPSELIFHNTLAIYSPEARPRANQTSKSELLSLSSPGVLGACLVCGCFSSPSLVFAFYVRNTAMGPYGIHKGVQSTCSRKSTSEVNTLRIVTTVRKEECNLSYEGHDIMEIFTDLYNCCPVSSVSLFLSLMGVIKITTISPLSLYRGRFMKKTRSH